MKAGESVLSLYGFVTRATARKVSNTYEEPGFVQADPVPDDVDPVPLWPECIFLDTSVKLLIHYVKGLLAPTGVTTFFTEH